MIVVTITQSVMSRGPSITTKDGLKRPTQLKNGLDGMRSSLALRMQTPIFESAGVINYTRSLLIAHKAT